MVLLQFHYKVDLNMISWCDIEQVWSFSTLIDKTMFSIDSLNLSAANLLRHNSFGKVYSMFMEKVRALMVLSGSIALRVVFF